ncbi:MAG: hypothetical protein IJF40_01180 [Clostridia bacterium]|nr:hypothetical protein [Clostridia bacterium]
MELPLGFGMALAQNEPAMKAFEAMSEEQKKAVVAQLSSVKSKREMQAFVNGLTKKS